MDTLDIVKELGDKYGATIYVSYVEAEGLWYATVYPYSDIKPFEIKKIDSHANLINYLEKDIKKVFEREM